MNDSRGYVMVKKQQQQKRDSFLKVSNSNNCYVLCHAVSNYGFKVVK